MGTGARALAVLMLASLEITVSEEPRSAMRAAEGGSLRASRSGEAEESSVFTAPEDLPLLQAQPGIVADMRAHLQRRRKRADADLITSGQGLLQRGLNSVVGIFKSRYFRNARRSVMLLASCWLWYVFNTRSYTPPEYDD